VAIRGDGARGPAKTCCFLVRLKTMRGKFVVAAMLKAIVGVVTLAPHAAQARGETVTVKESFAPGTILVRTSERRLYYFTGNGRAIRYSVGVGRAGKQWSGTSHIEGKYIRPDWSPPDVIRSDHPGLPKVIRGGSPRNPMGVAALSLAGGEYAIHGTNQPASIGHFISYGCIRMYNEDIRDLYKRVGVGTRVVVQ
jgi:lipoprotein-anchoring transpeptidase ErfK/SrfK